ncbi:MAG: 2-oxoacid:acceptor oxidoreductase family protein [Candidatus Micrarchaeia archaeon]
MRITKSRKTSVKNASKITNIVVSGVGGQGVLTLAVAIAESALRQGYDVMTAEVHGLAMRFGHLEVHIRFGKKVLSPLVPDGEADLIIGLEPIETLRAVRYMDKNTAVVFDTSPLVPNKMHIHKEKYPDTKNIITTLRKISKSVLPIPASDVTTKMVGSDRYANIYVLGCLVKLGLINISQRRIMEVLNLLPSPDINRQVFSAGLKGISR